MSELEDKIKTLLDSPEEISKIVSTAQNLFGGKQSRETDDVGEERVEEIHNVPALSVNDEEENLLEKLDPKVISTAMQIMGEYRKTDDRRIQLLHALRSYFKDEDQVHITKAIQIVKLSKVAKQAFRSMREEDSFV